MERKRKLPARAAARSEVASKKRASTTPEQRTHTPTPSIPPPVVEEPLPRSLIAGRPLPTVNEPQPENLSSKEYQSVAESGVLAESLKRSRQTWISEGIFEKYWTKVTKRKGGEVTNNPAKESMTKLGTCTITVEPHIIEAVMYAIKEPTRPTPSPSQQPMYRPIIQYGPPNGTMPPPPPPAAPSPVQQRPNPPQPVPQSPQTTHNISMQNPTHPPSTSSQQPSPNMARASPHNGTSSNPQHTHNGAPAPPPQGKSTDPVIQMLAERAASDPDLKALMRIVANGEATPEELKRFQSHIDELTRLQRARQAAAQPPQSPSSNHPPSTPVSTPQLNGTLRPTQSQAASPSSQPRRASSPSAAPQSQFQPPPVQPQALRSKGPLPPSKPDISGVVFEFTGGNGDRYLFPKFSILEYLPQGQVIASFLIVRKGSSSESPSYDPALDYYQPITIRLYAHQGRQLDALQKVVAPQEEVRRYMDDIMDNMTRAEYVLLAMRLPKDQEHNPAEKETTAPVTAPVTMDNQVLWATTHQAAVATSASPAMKPTERLMTEEEKYQSFIQTVST